MAIIDCMNENCEMTLIIGSLVTSLTCIEIHQLTVGIEQEFELPVKFFFCRSVVLKCICVCTSPDLLLYERNTTGWLKKSGWEGMNIVYIPTYKKNWASLSYTSQFSVAQ